jgi:hypothetical protein
VSSEFLNLRFMERWMLEGLCSTSNRWDDWFAPENTVTARDATAACWECPIRVACLQHAADTKEPYGIRGGIPASVRKEFNHDFVWLSYEPNPYVRDRWKTNRSKFAEAGLRRAYTVSDD